MAQDLSACEETARAKMSSPLQTPSLTCPPPNVSSPPGSSHPSQVARRRAVELVTRRQSVTGQDGDERGSRNTRRDLNRSRTKCGTPTLPLPWPAGAAGVSPLPLGMQKSRVYPGPKRSQPLEAPRERPAPALPAPPHRFCAALLRGRFPLFTKVRTGPGLPLLPSSETFLSPGSFPLEPGGPPPSEPGASATTLLKGCL